MNILLTNDDGMYAPGLWAAARVLAEFAQVTVIAPVNDYSGYGPALPRAITSTMNPTGGQTVTPLGVAAYALAGSPATCAHVGLSGALGGGPFDLLVSGINHGANLGYDVFYSGTVGAALTAHLLSVPAIAVSLATGGAGVEHWDAAAHALPRVVRLWEENREASAPFFNVNVPNLPHADSAEMLVTVPSRTSILRKYRFTPHSHEEYVLVVSTGEPELVVREPWADDWAVGRGCIAVTPFKAFVDLLTVVPLDAPPEAASGSLFPVSDPNASYVEIP